MKVRKKPVEGEAWPVRELIEQATRDWDALPQPIQDAYNDGRVFFNPDTIDIETLEGWHRAGQNDFVIRGVAGELYPIKPDIFEQTYEAAGLNGWISCKDRLPDENSDVLVVTSHSEIHLLNFCWTEDGNATYEKSDVTHWRPLPELPKE